jgi:hypothetical protein
VRKIICSIIVSLTAAASASAGDLGDLAARSIQAHTQISTIQADMEAALGDRQSQVKGLNAAIDQLEDAPMSPEELSAFDTEIEKETERLAQFRELGTPDDSLVYTYSRILELSMQRNAGSIQSKPKRKEFATKIQGEFNRITSEIEQIETPFENKISKITEAVSDEDSELSDELSQFFNEFNGISLKPTNATMHTAFAGLEWYNPSGERVAWAHIRIRSTTEIVESDREDMLKGKFPVRTANDNSLWVWAGNFLITFVPVDEKLKDEDTLKNKIFDFVDLKALAQVDAQPNNVLAEVFTD